MNFIRTLFIVSLITIQALAQTSTGQVSSLVAAENYFAALAKEKGASKAFKTVSDDATIILKSDSSVNSNKQPQDLQLLNWQPSFAKISKSGDWGFTSGLYSITQEDNNDTSYGEYASVWKMNKKGVWKLAINIVNTHPRPKTEPILNYTDPKEFKFFKQISERRLQQREDMVLTSDKLFSTALVGYKNLAYNVFLGDDARLLFPGYEPIIGKGNITDFLRYQDLSITTEPLKANRSLGSDLAYTYGKATVTKDNKVNSYNYVRIWEVQEGYKWNVILEVFSPAS